MKLHMGDMTMKQNRKLACTKLTLQTGKETRCFILSGTFKQTLKHKILCLENADATLVGLCIKVENKKETPSDWFIATIFAADDTFYKVLTKIKQLQSYARYYRKKSDFFQMSAFIKLPNWKTKMDAADAKEDAYLSKAESYMFYIQSYPQQHYSKRLDLIDYLL